MKKIRKLIIENFQSHKNTTIDFQDYAIIHGATNSGKSAIIRAIKWCLYNEAPPDGAEIIRFGESEASVTIVFDDGKTIKRVRGNKINSYLLTDENGNTREFTGFGRGPLKEVMDFHKMYMANLFGEAQSINIVDQQEPPFFLSEGPTARGHLISRLADTLVYESALIMIKKDIHEARKNIEKEHSEAEKLKKEISELGYVSELEEFISGAKMVEDEIKANASLISKAPISVSKLSDAISLYGEHITNANELDSIETSVCTAGDVEKSEALIKRLRGQVTAMKDAVEKHFHSYGILDTLNDVQEKFDCANTASDNELLIRRMTNILHQVVEKLEAMAVLNDELSIADEILCGTEAISDLEGKLSVQNQIRQKTREISLMITKLKEAHTTTEELSAEINKRNERYKNILVEGGVCPTCHNKIVPETLTGVEL